MGGEHKVAGVRQPVADLLYQQLDHPPLDVGAPHLAALRPTDLPTVSRDGNGDPRPLEVDVRRRQREQLAPTKPGQRCDHDQR